MIIPCMCIQGGRAVGRRGGGGSWEDLGDPRLLAEGLSRAGELAVVDLDGALGTRDNRDLVLDLVRRFPCRVAGGLEDREAARAYLNAGARRLLLKAEVETPYLDSLPRDRLMAALDLGSEGDLPEVTRTLARLRPFVGGFLLALPARELSKGPDATVVRLLREAAGDARLSVAIAGANPTEVGQWDGRGVDVQDAAAPTLGPRSLAEAFAAPLVSEHRDGRWPTIICDEGGRALGLGYTDLESLTEAFENRREAYTSGSTPSEALGCLLRAELDPGRESLRFTVRREAPEAGAGLARLAASLMGDPLPRLDGAGRDCLFREPLFREPAGVAARLREGAEDLLRSRGPEEAAAGAADLLYIALAKALSEGASVARIEAELDRRALRVTPTTAKPKPAFVHSLVDLSWQGLH